MLAHSLHMGDASSLLARVLWYVSDGGKNDYLKDSMSDFNLAYLFRWPLKEGQPDPSLD